MTQDKSYLFEDNIIELHNLVKTIDKSKWSRDAVTSYHCACYARAALFATLADLDKDIEKRNFKLTDGQVIEKAQSHMRDWRIYDNRLRRFLRG